MTKKDLKSRINVKFFSEFGIERADVRYSSIFDAKRPPTFTTFPVKTSEGLHLFRFVHMAKVNAPH